MVRRACWRKNKLNEKKAKSIDWCNVDTTVFRRMRYCLAHLSLFGFAGRIDYGDNSMRTNVSRRAQVRPIWPISSGHSKSLTLTDRALRRLLLTILQAGRFECDDRGLIAHVAEALGQRTVLRTQIGHAQRLEAGLLHLCLVERALRLGPIVFAQRHQPIPLPDAILHVRHRQ